MALTEIPIELSSTPGIVDNSNATAITIDSSENVGIGTASPTGNLEIATSAADTGVDLILDGNRTSNGGIGSIVFNNNGDSVGMIRSNRASANDAADMLFYTQATGGANAERLRLDSAGNVGIGLTPTAYANYNTLAQSGTSGVTLEQRVGSTLTGSLTADSQVTLNAVTAIPLVFKTTNTERMRLDASGNLLVGKTASSYTTDGFEALAAGAIQVSDTSTNPVGVNRNGTDGSLISFFKAGTAVGSINTEGNDLAIGNDDAGIQFVNGTEHFRPFNMTTNAATDALMDIGSTSKRFKDLHLSGSITSGANGGLIKEIGGDTSIVQGAIGLRINDSASALSPTTASVNNDASVDLGVSNIRFKDLYLSGEMHFNNLARGRIENYYVSGSGRTFTITGGSNGMLAELKFEASNHQGYVRKYYHCYNSSGNWFIDERDGVNSGTTQTVTVSGNGTGTVTVNVVSSTGSYTGGVLNYEMKYAVISVS